MPSLYFGEFILSQYVPHTSFLTVLGKKRATALDYIVVQAKAKKRDVSFRMAPREDTSRAICEYVSSLSTSHDLSLLPPLSTGEKRLRVARGGSFPCNSLQSLCESCLFEYCANLRCLLQARLFRIALFTSCSGML